MGSVEVSQIRALLLAMAQADQALRAQIDGHTAGDGTVEPGFLGRWQQLDRAHTDVLRAIVAEHGWPGHRLAGVDGAHAAWLLAQHASLNEQLLFQQLLRAAVDAGDATALQLAYLDDRVAMRQGRPQRYGTQMIRQGAGPLRLYDTTAMNTLDERRAAIGLGPVADQLAQANPAPHRLAAEDNQ